jgi:hypothetical protein
VLLRLVLLLLRCLLGCWCRGDGCLGRGGGRGWHWCWLGEAWVGLALALNLSGPLAVLTTGCNGKASVVALQGSKGVGCVSMLVCV